MIDKCVVCGYSLEGLPTVHRCPECGRENDRDSLLFGQKRAAWVGLTLAMCAALVVQIVFGAAVTSPIGRAVGLLSTTFMVLFCGRQVSRPKRVIVVSSRCIELIDPGRGVSRYALADIADATRSEINGQVTITDRGGATVVTIPVGFLDSNRGNKKVVAAIKHYVAQRDHAAAPGE